MSETSGGRTGQQPSDGELIAATRTGDTDAYESLYRRHSPASQSLARRLARDEAEADDLVAETFTRILALLRRGDGPHTAFRPYLYTVMRRIKYDRARAEQRQATSAELETIDPGEPFVDPALEGLERSLVARAYLSLPERWQAVLWHTEVEGAKPAEIATLLGVTANGAAAVAYRAREGLRQAYLQEHVRTGAAETCRPALDNLGAYIRGGLSRRDNATVETHLESCADCSRVYGELAVINESLRTIVGPLIAGPAAAGGSIGAGAGGGILSLIRGAPKKQQAAVGGGIAAAIVAALLAWALSGQEGDVPAPPPPPSAAAPPNQQSTPNGQAPDQPPNRARPASNPPADAPASPSTSPTGSNASPDPVPPSQPPGVPPLAKRPGAVLCADGDVTVSVGDLSAGLSARVRLLPDGDDGRCDLAADAEVTVDASPEPSGDDDDDDDVTVATRTTATAEPGRATPESVEPGSLDPRRPESSEEKHNETPHSRRSEGPDHVGKGMTDSLTLGSGVRVRLDIQR